MRANGVVAAAAAACLWMWAGAGGAEAGTNPCDLRPFQTVDNGLGAEPGVVREFDSGITVPPGCLRDGRTWVPRLGVNLTRTAGGPSTIAFQIIGRRPMPPARAVEPPGNARFGPIDVVASGIPLFPSASYFTYDTAGPAGNVNNVLWGDYMYLGGALDGDTTPQVFITADEVGTPGAVPCFTGIDGALPADLCTNGAPDLNALGVGAQTYTFYGRYASGDQVMGNRQPMSSTFAARYLATQQRAPEGTGVDLRFREGPAGPVICQYFDIPPDFEADCVLTTPQIDLLEAGGVFAELAVSGGSTDAVRMLPAGLFLFADGFESGDTSVWATAVQ